MQLAPSSVEPFAEYKKPTLVRPDNLRKLVARISRELVGKLDTACILPDNRQIFSDDHLVAVRPIESLLSHSGEYGLIIITSHFTCPILHHRYYNGTRVTVANGMVIVNGRIDGHSAYLCTFARADTTTPKPAR